MLQSVGPMKQGTPLLMIPAFSNAIDSRFDPRISTLSKAMEVIAVAKTFSIILVGHNLPPTWHSITAKSTL